MSEIELSVSFPLDKQGFLRRACHVCGREFKWLSTEEDASSPAPEQYFCPYCGSSASHDEWFTLEQRAYINTAVLDEVVGPAVDELGESLRQLSRSSGGLIEVTASFEPSERRQAPPVYEPDDMKRVTFICHPNEPVKIEEAWSGRVHCRCCGRFSDGKS